MVGVGTYGLDFVVDPATIVKSLAKQGLVTEGYVRPSRVSYKITNDVDDGKQSINRRTPKRPQRTHQRI